MTLLTALPAIAQNMDPQTLDVDLSEPCRSELEREVDGLNCDELDPVVVDTKSKSGESWKVRFHFGFSRTQYHPTDMDIKSSQFTGTIEDVTMYERTSASHYDPKNWDGFLDSFKWIDEPTNTFALSLEKGKNKFYMTAFHPKYIKSVLYKETDDGIVYAPGAPDNALNQDRPDGFSHLYIQNTHMNMVWQVGYGRELRILDGKAGRLSYIPKADVGFSTGAARSSHIERDEDGDWQWDDHTEKTKVQGLNASIGHRVEYAKGKFSLFVDHKTIVSRRKHDYLDGTAEYNLRMSPVTFGIGITLFDGKNKKKK